MDQIIKICIKCLTFIIWFRKSKAAMTFATGVGALLGILGLLVLAALVAMCYYWWNKWEREKITAEIEDAYSKLGPVA